MTATATVPPATLPNPDLAALHRIQALLHGGREADALHAAQDLLDRATLPAWLHADLYNLAGAAAHALADQTRAARMWQLAVACASPAAAVQPAFNLAQLHLEQGRTREAQEWLREVLTRAPNHVEAAARLGVLLAQQGQLDVALAWYRHALRLDPGHATAQANLALALAESGQLDAAEQAYERALELDPDNPATHTHLGVLYAATRRPGLAEASHRRALALDPSHASAHANLGLVLGVRQCLEPAFEHLRRAHELAPEQAQIQSNLGNALARLGREDEAERHHREALARDPDAASSHLNLGVLLCDRGQDAEAEVRLRAALALRPRYALAQLDLSCLLLAQGRYEEGWRLHEARHDPALPDNGIAPPNVTLPVWTGQSLHGKSLLIWPEQGLGDQIQFCRFVPELKARGARHVTLVCQQPLRPLFETLPGVDRVIGARIQDNAFHVDPELLGPHDHWTFPLSIPRLLGIDLESLPGTAIPYLSAPQARRADWRQRHDVDALAHRARLRVGLVWQGNPLHNNDAERSMPGLQTLEPLWSVPGVRFVSLQTGSGAAQAAMHAQPSVSAQPLMALGAQLHDFADTAAALEPLDLLVCVDTSIAHLAGAMGLPCWVMLPHRKTDWRWLRDRDESPWYPSRMRLFRQTTRGDWADVVRRVTRALQERVDWTPPPPMPA